MIFFARNCLDGLRFNKLRVLFTGAGVLIGVASVILIVALSDSFMSNLAGADTDRFTIGLVSSAESNVDVVRRIGEPDMVSRLAAIAKRPDVASLEPSARKEMVSATLADASLLSDLQVEFADDVPVTEGVPLAEAVGDVVIAYRNTDFKSALPLNAEISVNGAKFTVIGLTDYLGANGSTRLFFPTRLHGIVQTESIPTSSSLVVVAANPSQLEGLRASVLAQLNANIEPDLAFIDFSAEETTAVQDLLRTVGAFLGLIASISLAVAALNIVTVMYIATLERADEVAILRSMGMTRRDLQLVFLFESVVVVTIFAVLGIVLGNVLALIILAFLKTPMVFSLGNILVLLVVVAVIGGGGGLYPAYRAAKIDPVRLLH